MFIFTHICGASKGFTKAFEACIKPFETPRSVKIKISVNFFLSSRIGMGRVHIFINDILFFAEKSGICNFTDDNTIYSCEKDLKIKENLTCTMKNMLKWFRLNS